MQGFENGRVFFGSTLQDVVLLLLQFIDSEEDLGRHIVHFGLLFKSVNDVWQIVEGDFDWLGLFEQFRYQFIVVADLVLTLLQLILIILITFVV